ncbi:MAG: S1 RNA-binding domain-containing protein [Bacilli bacterium]|nr:S1 RNA-binding domain-containing protein [Bacilli bacterium]
MEEFVIGSLVIGKVEAIRPYAVFMSFSDGRNGLLHISEISDAYIRDIEKFASVGDEIKVKIIDIDPNNGFLRVSLKQVPEEEAFSTHQNNRRDKVDATSDEFKTLAEKLPNWIEEAYQKAKEDENND